MKHPGLLVMVGATVCAAACTEDSEPPAPVHDEALCKVAASYALASTTAGTVGVAGGGHPTVSVPLDAGPPRDVLFFKLISGAGVFAGGLRTGTFSLSGVDAGFTTCGLCVNVVADIVAGQGPTKFYQATAGEVTLTSVTSPYAGSVSNLVFAEVDGNGAPVPGCTTKVTTASFTAP